MPIRDCKVGRNTVIHHPELVNLYGCTIGDDCMVGSFTEIGPGVKIGNRVRVQAHCYIPSHVEVADDVFIGPHARFLNDKYPPLGYFLETFVEEEVVIGGGATILPGVRLGKGCVIAAGAVVTKSTELGMVYMGVPANPTRNLKMEKLIDVADDLSKAKAWFQMVSGLTK